MTFVIAFDCHNTIPAREQRHRDALAKARNQMSLNLRTPAEEAGEAATVPQIIATSPFVNARAERFLCSRGRS